MAAHLACAAHELPILAGPDAELFGGQEALHATLHELLDLRVLGKHPQAVGPSASLHYIGEQGFRILRGYGFHFIHVKIHVVVNC